ncbi:unnamed protein product [Rotaria sordida]|uniref:Uncharacterized protein n=1 Tax=Rotaria sordida TaxID=392033 RepID=A0A815ISH2_9BILA|nr:unnamed protein product [Rotaria sordida]CAF1369531.1 unnamed protein product [Rotaria sordida]CAF3794931.1 unnamed protein product [Rotaria sordida]CAF3992801.1 unnamed protein product [Rotaria sordida]
MIADQDEIWKKKCNISTKLYSKSFKQIYIDWFYQKCLHNRDLQSRTTIRRNGCFIGVYPGFSVQPIGKHKFEPIGGFTQHPISSSEMTIQLSFDIEDTACELIKLLEKASKFRKEWQQSSILKQMIMRYYRFMQLKASHSDNLLLIPTLDIEIVWQTHLLRSEIYNADCIRLFHRVINHKLLNNDMEEFLKEQAFQDTCQLYEQTFDEKYCPLLSTDRMNHVASNIFDYSSDLYGHKKTYYSYWDKTYFEYSLKSTKDFENPFSFAEDDINSDMNWLDECKNFMVDLQKKLSISNYYSYGLTKINLETTAMNGFTKSYEKFLYMAAKYPLKDGNSFIPPTYAIDIIWRAHMQEPLNYVADCLRLVGYVISHDPWPIVKDNNMKNSYDRIDQIWKQEFGSDKATDHLYDTYIRIL